MGEKQIDYFNTFWEIVRLDVVFWHGGGDVLIIIVTQGLYLYLLKIYLFNPDLVINKLSYLINIYVVFN